MSSAIIEITQQPMMYQEIPVVPPVPLSSAVAINGAGPPAVMEASW